MTFEQFKDTCFALALEQGCEAAEIYATSNDGFGVNVLNGEIIKYSVERTAGLNLRVIFGGRSGYAYTEAYDDPEGLVRHAVDNAKSIENTDKNPMQGACEYPAVTIKPNPYTELSEQEKIDMALALEKKTLDFDDRVNRMGYCEIGTGAACTRICNTLGLNAESKRSYSAAVVGPILRQGEEEREAYAFRFNGYMRDEDGMIKEAVDNALMQFNAKPVDSGEYRVLLRNDVAMDLLRSFSSMFFADRVQKGLSLMQGRLGEKVACPLITILDDPFEEDNPRAFDDEGVPSVLTEVVKDGVLKGFLYNLKSALKDGVSSTSNAGRGGPAEPVDTAASNFYIVKGDKSYDQLVAQLDSGLIITELSGLHAGLNPVSGDFSLLAKGLLVHDGSVVRSVDQITCAGNFISLMNNIIGVGSDLKFGFPGGGRFGSPSLLIEKLMIAGK